MIKDEPTNFLVYLIYYDNELTRFLINKYSFDNNDGMDLYSFLSLTKQYSPLELPDDVGVKYFTINFKGLFTYFKNLDKNET